MYDVASRRTAHPSSSVPSHAQTLRIGLVSIITGRRDYCFINILFWNTCTIARAETIIARRNTNQSACKTSNYMTRIIIAIKSRMLIITTLLRLASSKSGLGRSEQTTMMIINRDLWLPSSPAESDIISDGKQRVRQPVAEAVHAHRETTHARSGSLLWSLLMRLIISDQSRSVNRQPDL